MATLRKSDITARVATGLGGSRAQGEAALKAVLSSIQDALDFEPADTKRISYITQTTLSIDDTSEIVNILKTRFPDIKGPNLKDIC